MYILMSKTLTFFKLPSSAGIPFFRSLYPVEVKRGLG